MLWEERPRNPVRSAATIVSTPTNNQLNVMLGTTKVNVHNIREILGNQKNRLKQLATKNMSFGDSIFVGLINY